MILSGDNIEKVAVSLDTENCRLIVWIGFYTLFIERLNYFLLKINILIKYGRKGGRKSFHLIVIKILGIEGSNDKNTTNRR